MYSIPILLVLIPIFNCMSRLDLEENDMCITDTGGNGTCLLLPNCPTAMRIIPMRGKPKLCGFVGKVPIVCCEDELKNISLAEQKCDEYRIKSITTTTTQEPLPDNVYGIWIGEYTRQLEFPHMAILGYEKSGKVHWSCGGNLISETFVLTAAHCLTSKHGNLSTIRLGVNDIYYPSIFEQEFSVKRRIPYPEYSWKLHYHDIALVELNRPANIQRGIKPACLDTSEYMSNDSLIATGWGLTENYFRSLNLLKVKLQYVPHYMCKDYYVDKRHLPRGLVDEWQICASGREKGADTCQGDSGGPLQYAVDGDDMYTIVGITSIGMKCGYIPSVYTRVAYYVPWIESMVWPD